MGDIEPGQLIDRHGSGHPSRVRIQKAYPGFLPTIGKMTRRSRIRKQGSRDALPGLPSIRRSEYADWLCCYSRCVFLP